jgi:hypothetical protein
MSFLSKAMHLVAASAPPFELRTDQYPIKRSGYKHTYLHHLNSSVARHNSVLCIGLASRFNLGCNPENWRRTGIRVHRAAISRLAGPTPPTTATVKSAAFRSGPAVSFAVNRDNPIIEGVLPMQRL